VYRPLRALCGEAEANDLLPHRLFESGQSVLLAQNINALICI